MARVTVEVWPWPGELFGGSSMQRHVSEVKIPDGTDVDGLLGYLSDANQRFKAAMDCHTPRSPWGSWKW